MPEAIEINDQPMSASFFGEGSYLTSYITPDALEIENLHDDITRGIDDLLERAVKSWSWVANNLRYVRFVNATINIAGKVSRQTDYWQMPSQAIRTKVGNCANKSFLLGSLLRRDFTPQQMNVVLGNLYQNGDVGGHAWCEINIDGTHSYIMESTRGDMPPMVASEVADIYEPVIYFNDEMVAAIEGRTVLTPFCSVYADWLKDYLDWAYIGGDK